MAEPNNLTKPGGGEQSEPPPNGAPTAGRRATGAKKSEPPNGRQPPAPPAAPGDATERERGEGGRGGGGGNPSRPPRTPGPSEKRNNNINNKNFFQRSATPPPAKHHQPHHQRASLPTPPIYTPRDGSTEGAERPRNEPYRGRPSGAKAPARKHTNPTTNAPAYQHHPSIHRGTARPREQSDRGMSRTAVDRAGRKPQRESTPTTIKKRPRNITCRV